ncbi:MAG: 30S ribosomal protein S18 [Candidatus Levybacteria bacterium]|nr:30S ribosomal protein S18 [Candidatus Levybacteria bacterium]
MKKNKIVKKRRNLHEPVKECSFCKEKRNPDFMEYEILKRFISERGKIQSRQRTGVCSKHQRKLTTAVKRARLLAFLPFIVRAE